MAKFTALEKRAFLRNIWEGAADSANGFRDALIAASRANIQSIEGGYLITSHSGAGVSTQFSVPEMGGLTPLTLAALCEELLMRFEHAAAYLAANDLDSTNEALVYPEMLARIRPIRRVSTDFSWGYA